MKKLLPLLLISVISFNGVQASVVQMPTVLEEFSSTIHRNFFLIDEARVKADLEDNAGIFYEAQKSLFKKHQKCIYSFIDAFTVFWALEGIRVRC